MEGSNGKYDFSLSEPFKYSQCGPSDSPELKKSENCQFHPSLVGESIAFEVIAYPKLPPPLYFIGKRLLEHGFFDW